MSFLSEWLTNIILFILLATVLELLLPNSKLQRYVKMVIGLLLLVIILNPLLSIFSKDINDLLPSFENHTLTENQLENSIESKKIEIQQGQLAYISEQVAVQMKRQVEEELINSFDMKVLDVFITLEEFASEPVDQESIASITVHLEQASNDVEESQMVEAVEVVKIDTKSEIPVETTDVVDLGPIEDLLEDEWQIPKDKISLVWEGGEQ